MLKLIGAEGCAGCARLKKVCDSAGIEYEYIDAGTAEGLSELYAVGRSASRLPVVIKDLPDGLYVIVLWEDLEGLSDEQIAATMSGLVE
jgi:glutaredoxin